VKKTTYHTSRKVTSLMTSQYCVFLLAMFFVVFLTAAMVTLSKVVSACKVVLLCYQCDVKLPLWNFLWRHRSNITLFVSFWAGSKKICYIQSIKSSGCCNQVDRH